MYSSNFKVTMIVAAAGVGKRMGLGYPKQFLEYKGKPLFIMPLEAAQNSNIVDEIIVVTNKENVSLVENYNFSSRWGKTIFKREVYRGVL